jgi:hypothetical protein
MRWAGLIVCMWSGEAYTGFWLGNLRERDPGIDGRIILRWIFRMWDVGVGTGSSWLRIRDRWRTLVNAVMSIWVA